jgi:hypothetical protein
MTGYFPQKPSFWPLFGLIILWLTACAPSNLLVEAGLMSPTPTPDPFALYRAGLQPFAQTDIEAAGPLPRYHITARLSDDQSRLTGEMQVVIPPPDSPELVFRLYPNLKQYSGSIAVTQATVNGVPVEAQLLAEGSAIALPSPAGTGPVTVELAFVTQLGRADAPDDYTLFGWNGSILSLPGSFPTLAARPNDRWVTDVPPAFGDVLFNEAALYQLDLTLPGELQAVSGGVTRNVIDNGDGRRTWQIAGGPLRDLTVVAGPFASVSESAAGATVTSYYLPGHEATGRAVLGHATASLRLYHDLFGPYPYLKLEVVEAPLGLRGMEYTGLILIGAEHYTRQRQSLSFLVAHETAHQWWYAVVGSNPYQHPWLDEGLAEYSAFDYYRTVFGQSRAEELLAGRWQFPFEAAANGGLDGRLDQPAAAFDEYSYEVLVYGKAALFFNALRREVGDDTYRAILHSYYAENRYKIASPQTFLATAGRVSGQNLNPLAAQWLRCGP